MPLVSVGHCIDCPSLIYGFWLFIWYFLTIVLTVLRYTASRYAFGICPYIKEGVNTIAKRYQRHNQKPYIKEGQSIQWSKDTKGITRSRISKKDCIDSFFDIRLLLCLWHILTIALTVLLWYTASGYAFGIFWPLYWLSFFDIRLLLMPLISIGHCIDYPLIYAEAVYQRRTVNAMAKRYQRHNQKPYIKEEQSMQWSKYAKGITEALYQRRSQYNCQKIPKGPPLIYSFWLCLWYLLAILLTVLLCNGQ
jgi:hypothetical protein